MFNKYALALFFNIFFFFTFSHQTAFAIENPLAVPNNKIGIHILFDHELKAASELVNSSGGDWGYVTIVIQAKDKDLEKWQKFMTDAKTAHVIPIVRLSTESDYFNTNVWRKPDDSDIIDFANFLDSLEWPTKNRYIAVFNEVNRGNEWGGKLNPAEYAQILSFATTVFKSKNPDYFILPAGLDNAAPNQGETYMNQYTYMRLMNQSVPGIFNQVDGHNSHSYPNPGFSQPPSVNSPMGINSFQYEISLIRTLSQKNLPVFITETGWATDVVEDSKAANFYRTALNTVWKDPSIVAITPFLLEGNGGAFQKFSMYGINKTLSQQYQALKNFPKTKGMPVISNKVLAAETKATDGQANPTIDFSKHKPKLPKEILPASLHGVYKWLLRID